MGIMENEVETTIGFRVGDWGFEFGVWGLKFRV